MNWTARDWTSVIVGWLCGFAAMWILPEEPWKIFLTFLAAFAAAWITRQLIPR